MFLKRLTLKNFRQFNDLDIKFQLGVTALVGRNDAGKSAVIDAIRLALQTRDQEFFRIQPEDFHVNADSHAANEISIVCVLAGLSDDEKGAFIEYLSYEGNEVALHVNWLARRMESPSSRRWVDINVRSGIDGAGPAFEGSVRQLLYAAYLRPLRDAEREMSSGRGSRLSSILSSIPEICDGESFDRNNPPADAQSVSKLSLVGLAEYMCHNIRNHAGIGSAQSALNTRYLASLLLTGENIQGQIDISEGGSEASRLRQILERLELGLLDSQTEAQLGRYGLGSNNLLYMACELLLLGREPEGLPLLMIEEPEAHLHPQRQLRLMEFLNKASTNTIEGTEHSVQVLLTTHSPNLASKIPLENLVLLQGRRAFSLAQNETNLDKGDYRFLERFLDVTKANLFFAHGVLIVEGDAEAILIPTLANLIGRDFTEYGVSIVNVGGSGLKRFGRIFQRSDENAPPIQVPVACLADMDVMPDCAPEILGLVNGDDDEKWHSPRRRWRTCCDFGSDETARSVELTKRRDSLKANDGQFVKTFVADHWTLEYDLAYSGLAKQVHRAAFLAKNDTPLNADKKSFRDVILEARQAFTILVAEAGDDKAALCSRIYKLFHSEGASKAVAAQYLAEILLNDCEKGSLDAGSLRKTLPKYIVDAIDYVTNQAVVPHNSGDGPDG